MLNYNFKTQSIGLEGVINARELGGYVFPGGRTVRKGLLLRGGSLFRATDGDIAKLKDEFALSHCFDFRTKVEIDMAPDRLVPGSQHHWMPTIDASTEKIGTTALPHYAYRDLENFLIKNSSQPMVQMVAMNMYPEMVRNEYTQLQYAAFLEMIADTEEGAVYWHCSQGKDRTGFGAALLLAALGADREIIMQDFAISNEFYSDILNETIEKVLQEGGGRAEIDVVRTFIGVNVDYFMNALDIIDNEYGSMMEYLTGPICLSEEDIYKMRERLLL